MPSVPYLQLAQIISARTAELPRPWEATMFNGENPGAHGSVLMGRPEWTSIQTFTQREGPYFLSAIDNKLTLLQKCTVDCSYDILLRITTICQTLIESLTNW